MFIKELCKIIKIWKGHKQYNVDLCDNLFTMHHCKLYYIIKKVSEHRKKLFKIYCYLKNYIPIWTETKMFMYTSIPHFIMLTLLCFTDVAYFIS